MIHLLKFALYEKLNLLTTPKASVMKTNGLAFWYLWVKSTPFCFLWNLPQKKYWDQVFRGKRDASNGKLNLNKFSSIICLFIYLFIYFGYRRKTTFLSIWLVSWNVHSVFYEICKSFIIQSKFGGESKYVLTALL